MPFNADQRKLLFDNLMQLIAQTQAIHFLLRASGNLCPELDIEAELKADYTPQRHPVLEAVMAELGWPAENPPSIDYMKRLYPAVLRRALALQKPVAAN